VAAAVAAAERRFGGNNGCAVDSLEDEGVGYSMDGNGGQNGGGAANASWRSRLIKVLNRPRDTSPSNAHPMHAAAGGAPSPSALQKAAVATAGVAPWWKEGQPAGGGAGGGKGAEGQQLSTGYVALGSDGEAE